MTPTREALERLRHIAKGPAASSTLGRDLSLALGLLDRAAKVLEPFAERARDLDNGTKPDLRCEDDMDVSEASYDYVTVGECRAAQQFLSDLAPDSRE